MNRTQRFHELTRTDLLQKDLRSRSMTAAAMTGAAGMVDFGIRLVSTAILARLILPEHFGILMMVTAVTSIADQMRELGLSAATVQCKEITHERSTNLFWVSVVLSIVIAALVSAGSPLIARFYHEPRLIPITCILASNFLFGGLMVQHQALLTRQLKFGHTALVRLSSSVISTVVAIALAAAGLGYWALLCREVLRAALLAIGMWLCFPWVPSLPFRRVGVRDLIRFGADLAGANIFAGIMSSTDRFVLGRFWGAAPVAIYRQSYQLLLVPLDQLVFPLFQAGNPSLCLLQSDPARYRRFFQRLLTGVCLITMPVSLFVAVYAHEITLIMLGPRWLECAPILAILSFATFIRQPISATLVAPTTDGRSRTFLHATLAQNVAFVLCLCVGSIWGPRGVAFGEVTATYLMLVPVVHLATRNSPIAFRDVLLVFSRIGGASIAMVLALVAYRSFTPSMPPLLALVSGAGFAIAAFLLAWTTIPGGRTEFLALAQDVADLIKTKLSSRRATAPAPTAEPLPAGAKSLEPEVVASQT